MNIMKRIYVLSRPAEHYGSLYWNKTSKSWCFLTDATHFSSLEEIDEYLEEHPLDIHQNLVGIEMCLIRK